MRSGFASLITGPDPQLTRVNKFALLLGFNQICYPLTLALYIGHTGWQAWPVSLSAPFFAATLWLSRRSSFAARLWMPLIGMADTVLAQLSLGYDSDVWLFLFPSLALAALLLRGSEKLYLAALGAGALALFLFLPRPDLLPPDIAAQLASLNRVSALTLTGFAGWFFLDSKNA